MSEEEPETLQEEIEKRFCVKKINESGEVYYRLDCTKLSVELVRFIKELYDE